MGFWGPDDVCFNTWAEELSRILLTLGCHEAATYTFDEGEQGQPAYEFRREGDTLLVSVVSSLLSGAEGDSSFKEVKCRWGEFVLAASNFFSAFHSALIEQCPDAGPIWWNSNVPADMDFR